MTIQIQFFILIWSTNPVLGGIELDLENYCKINTSFFLNSRWWTQYWSDFGNWICSLIRRPPGNQPYPWKVEVVFHFSTFFFSNVSNFYKILFFRSSVEGRELTSEVYPISVDQLFTLLFTNSKFFMDFHANRKTFGKRKTSFDPNLCYILSQTYER